MKKNIDVEEITNLPDGFSIGMALGLEEIEKNADLNTKVDDNVKIIDKLYTYVVPSQKKGYVGRFKEIQKDKQQKGIEIDYAVFYLKNDQGEVISMIAGPIDMKNGKFTILNTATIEKERRKGYLRQLLRGTFVELYKQNFQVMDAFLDTNFAKDDKRLNSIKSGQKEVVDKFKNAVGEHLAVSIVEDFNNNKKSIDLLDTIADSIEKSIQKKVQEKRTNNFQVADHLMKKTPFGKVELDDSDKRFNDYYIKPSLDINVSQCNNVLKNKDACTII